MSEQVKIEIEYCGGWGYGPRFRELSKAIKVGIIFFLNQLINSKDKEGLAITTHYFSLEIVPPKKIPFLDLPFSSYKCS